MPVLDIITQTKSGDMNFSKVSDAALKGAFSAPGDRNRESNRTKLHQILLTPAPRVRTALGLVSHV